MSQQEVLALKGQPVGYGDGHILVSFGTDFTVADNQENVGLTGVRLRTEYGGRPLTVVVQAGWIWRKS